MDASQKILPDTADSGDEGHLWIGGCDAVELAAEYGTPLIVFDRATFEARARGFAAHTEMANVVYAAKAFCCVALCQLADDLGLGIDICSEGELATTLAAGFSPERIFFHGSNKLRRELDAAGAAAVGRVVVDSLDEFEHISAAGLRTRLLVRLTPGVEAHTHEYVQTGQEDSKFGLGIFDGMGAEAIKRGLQVEGCELVGVHMHIGSQIFELAAFELAIQRVADFLVEMRTEHGFEAVEFNVGGGLGVAHTHDEMTPSAAEATGRILEAVARAFGGRGLPIPGVFFEPGRALVDSSCVTLYRVGTVKKIPGVRTYVSVDGGMSDSIYQKGRSKGWEQSDRIYVSVDGGMSDNPRPIMYGGRYEAILANRPDESPDAMVRVVGSHCEPDVLINDIPLPYPRPGDLLCVPATGAYTYSMASNYNRVPRPAVVMVASGYVTEIIRRETVEDLVRLDNRLDGGDVRCGSPPGQH